MIAYANANQRAGWSLAPYNKLVAMVERSMPMDR